MKKKESQFDRNTAKIKKLMAEKKIDAVRGLVKRECRLRRRFACITVKKPGQAAKSEFFKNHANGFYKIEPYNLDRA